VNLRAGIQTTEGGPAAGGQSAGTTEGGLPVGRQSAGTAAGEPTRTAGAPAAKPIAAAVVYDERGLVPCVVQDWDSGEVLMLAYMNSEALRRTTDTGELHLWSRSRGELWHKGATSGNTQAVRALRVDCDGDTLLALVEPAGPACHTGERTCFHRGEFDPPAPHETLPALERTLAQRVRERPAGSYTVALLDDPPRIGEKVMEEAEEVARAARKESDERVEEEAADVLYHLLVLLHSRGRALADAERVLDGRRR
jgi:phosphoribosyl-ATP pyrophosphohydrolase/phosphoribosyl-AMP cyclohydrolase